MIALDKIKVCGNRECRLLLPADPSDEPHAGFWVAKRESGAGSRVLRFASWCKSCTREKARHDTGIRRRGRSYEARVPQDKEARARVRAERLVMLQEKHRESLADPKYVAAYRAKQRERARQRRRQAGIYPIRPDAREERLPIGPLATFFDSTELPTTQIARRVGVSEERIRHLRRGYYFHKLKSGESRRYEIRAVSFTVALRVAREFDVAMSDIWPDVFGTT